MVQLFSIGNQAKMREKILIFFACAAYAENITPGYEAIKSFFTEEHWKRDEGIISQIIFDKIFKSFVNNYCEIKKMTNIIE